ncbi:transmembrane protein 116 [Pseudophryne corroboree]|uniref:transmembrane protein 116 n=1 Tax=Pseudophryne corroboree TaxID=495146 RepID=UPI0030812D60
MGTEHFAWINVTATESWREVYISVLWIQVVTSLLSIVGSGSVIGYAVFKNSVKLPEVRPLFYLTLSDLLLALCWLVGAVLYRHSCPNNVSCYNLQAVGQMFYLSTFYYTLNYTWQTYSNMWRRLRNEVYTISDTECCIGRITTVLSSVVPFLFTVPVLIFGNIKQCFRNTNHSCLVLNVGSQITTNPTANTTNVCRALHFYTKAIFLSTFFLTVISILVISGYFYILFRRYQTTAVSLQYKQWAVITVTRRNLLLFLVIFVLCCLPAVTLAIRTLAYGKGTDEVYKIFYYIQALAAVSQGFLNCLAYGWTRQMLRCLKQNYFRDVDTQTPLLRSQKKVYASMQTSTRSIGPPSVSAL